MATYKTIHTNYGLARMAAAEVSGVPINLTHMAIGDGNGNPTTPVATQTGLVREVFRATVNRVYQDPDTPNKFTAELVIPAESGGWTMREIGIFDDSGSLFVVGNLPGTYKPTNGEGAFSDGFIRVIFLVTNAGIVTVLVDPNVAVASQTWVVNNVNAATILPGGLTHQVLRKVTNTDGDTEWADPTSTNVVVDVIEEEQTLSAAQTNINLVLANTTGLALYINGLRLPNIAGATGWQAHPTIATRAILGTGATAGDKLIAVQNEPASHLPDALEASNNLSDVQSVTTARTNLGVYSKAETDQKAPSGAVVHFARNTAPSGWLKANGASVSRTAYADLFASIGTTFGAGDGFTTFQLPDLRGEFIRGWDDGRGVDAGRGFGTFQSDALQNILGTLRYVNGGPVSTGAFRDDGPAVNHINSAVSGTDPATTFDASRVARTSTETRPRNRALLACIKY